MLLAAITGLYLAAGIYWFGRRRPGYSHSRHTISELGERGAFNALWVSWGVFLPVGLAMAATWLSYRASAAEAATLAAAISIGYVGGAIFPCDPGSPTHGSLRQGIHNLAGGVEYIGGTACLLALGRHHSCFMVPAAVVAISTLMISVPIAASARGLVQRVAECSLFGSLVLALSFADAA
jgi:hypothetical protein